MKKGASDSKAGQLIGIVPVCVAALTLTASGGALARDVTVGGGMSVGYEFEDRQYDEEEVATDQENATAQEQQQTPENRKNNNDERYSRLRLSPLVTLTSASERDEIAMRYAPSFWQDFETSDNDVDHDLQASLSRYLTKDWQAKLNDRYKLSDIVENRYGDPQRRPETTEDTPATDSTATLSDSENRRRYWTNDLSLDSEYKYQHDSMFVVGYRYGILKNTDTDPNGIYEDYDRHELLSTLSHRFNPVWKFAVFGSYVRGLFDNTGPDSAQDDGELAEDDKDLNEYRAATNIQAKWLEHHAQALQYSYYGADYDDPQNADSAIHDVTLGWRWDISKEVMFSLGAGPTYTKTEGDDGEWGYNGNTTFSYMLERGYFEFTANRGFEVLNFTGTTDNGLREFWQSRLKLNYQLQEKLFTDLYAAYRYEDEEIVSEITPAVTETGDETGDGDLNTERETFNRKRFSTGISFSYSFQQWYKLSLAYDYSRQDSEEVNDSFDEHRVALTLSYETDFFKW